MIVVIKIKICFNRVYIRIIILYNLGYDEKDVVPVDDLMFWDKCNPNHDNEKSNSFEPLSSNRVALVFS